MKKTILILVILLTLCSDLIPQASLEKILTEVEKNNTTLFAFRKTIDARKTGNKTDIFLQNPEIGFSYLWGNPAEVGNRVDFSLIQSFDFPTTYGYRKQISNLQNEQAELVYHKQLRDILLKTKLTCFDLIYTNGLRNEYARRLSHAENIAESYSAGFDLGETNILDFNKARLNLLNSKKELESINIQRNLLLSELAALNGGQVIDVTDTVFEIVSVPADFEQWYLTAEKSNPVLEWLKKEVDISQKQVQLNRAGSLPEFQTGYMSETIVNQQFRGITAGISIPLWENKNKVKYAMANSIASESIAGDNKLQFYSYLKAVHSKAIALHENVNDFRQNLQSLDNTRLLKKALDKGEISLINYMVEISIYYQSLNRLLELERDLNKTVAELKQYE